MIVFSCATVNAVYFLGAAISMHENRSSGIHKFQDREFPEEMYLGALRLDWNSYHKDESDDRTLRCGVPKYWQRPLCGIALVCLHIDGGTMKKWFTLYASPQVVLFPIRQISIINIVLYCAQLVAGPYTVQICSRVLVIL